MFQTEKRLLVGVVLLALLAVSATAANNEPITKETVVNGNNAFALDLYGKLRTAEGNLFFSPFSVSAALAMTYTGTHADTADQMADVLGFGANDAVFHDAFGALLRDFNDADRKEHYELRVANALWAQNGFRFLEDFTGLVRKTYGAGLSNVDFQGDVEAARKTINGWVEQQTDDKIEELFKPGVLNADSRLVLTNAVYFKGTWDTPFDEKATRDADFHLATSRIARQQPKSVTVPMMFLAATTFAYADLDTFQVLSMPYEGDQLSMIVLLPKTTDVEDRVALETSLTPDNLTAWLGKLKKKKVVVFLPKFKMTSEFSLNDTLSAMGMTDAFVENTADFSGMNGSKDLFIQAVVHKAYVDVNEEGTEAAGATGVGIGVTSVEPERVDVFQADRPFLFLIRDDATGSILFLGRVTNPKE